MSRVGPHLRCERGECPFVPPVHWKGVALPGHRSLRTQKTFSNFEVYIVSFLRFLYLYLRDSLNQVFRYFLFDFFLRDFSNKVF